VNAETKVQSEQWMHTHSPNKMKKFKQTCARKLMATAFAVLSHSQQKAWNADILCSAPP
jgi:hypothetical protein